MNADVAKFLEDHLEVSRRYFLRCGAAGVFGLSSLRLLANEQDRSAELQQAIDNLESWLTRPDDFEDVSRGDPKPHSLSPEQQQVAGLTRETWKLEVIADPEHPARLRSPLTQAKNTALDFAGLMELAKTHAVRFPKVMTCLNLGCPLGNGIWEGVPLRKVLWMTEPREDLRRVVYYGYHNNDSKQMFRSSLPVGRVLEDPYDLPPVILCYKLNDQWLTPERGGPVRVVVPEAYGFKSIKWLSHMLLSNIPHANDTYADQNNDVDSPLKTFCATLSVPEGIKPDQPIPLTGYAQVGISGLSKVQVWFHNSREKVPDGEHFSNAPWRDAEILPPPQNWGGDIPDNRIPAPTINFDSQTGRPMSWPIRLTKAHWAILHPGLPAGQYMLRCRTIDEKGNAQPLPRPFRKSGRAAIEQVPVVVKG